MKAAARRPVPKVKRTGPKAPIATATKAPAPAPAAKPRPPRPSPRAAAPPQLERARRQLPVDEREAGQPSAETQRILSAARTGSEELRHRLEEHTETSPTLTAGDVDANWGDAYAVGDEAPGGDNPTPDQDRVDDIGKALGVNYGASEELQGSEKIVERDRHRWELDPASSDDWPHDRD